MASSNSTTSAVCTAAQKKLCRRMAALFRLYGEICIAKGDQISANAWRYVASICEDIASKGPKFLEERIKLRQGQLDKCDTEAS